MLTTMIFLMNLYFAPIHSLPLECGNDSKYTMYCEDEGIAGPIVLTFTNKCNIRQYYDYTNDTYYLAVYKGEMTQRKFINTYKSRLKDSSTKHLYNVYVIHYTNDCKTKLYIKDDYIFFVIW